MDDLVKLDSVSGCIAQPEGAGPWPAVIVIHEWWGLDEQTRSVAGRIAELGYLAFAPDLYHGERAALGDNNLAAVLVQKYGPSATAGLQKAYDALKSHPDCNGKIAAMGFCFGGRMALSLGLLRPLDALVTFYGGGMQQLFDRLDKLKTPSLLGFFGDKDVSIPTGTVEEFNRLLARARIEHEIITYPDSGHAFFRDTDSSVYKPEAARDAWNRLVDYFARHLN